MMTQGNGTDGSHRCEGAAAAVVVDCLRLLRERATAAHAGALEIKETSKSWVVLTSTEVFKLKKPIRNHFQDLSTVVAREENCRNEVRLNRRLAPDVYLGAVPITREASGRLEIDGEGPAVDWLVHMRRLPEQRMLDRVILAGDARTDVTRDCLALLADRLTGFYGAAPKAPLAPADYVRHFAEEHVRNREVLTDHRFALGSDFLTGLMARFEVALSALAASLEDRVQQGRIVEGHGDLRPEHVCLVDPPVVIDCLEFSARLRMMDPFDELVFLGLECALLGAPDIETFLVERCAEGLEDRPRDALLRFYESYRALLRARQSLAHLLVPNPREPSKWLPKAQGYLAVADRALIMP